MLLWRRCIASNQHSETLSSLISYLFVLFLHLMHLEAPLVFLQQHRRAFFFFSFPHSLMQNIWFTKERKNTAEAPSSTRGINPSLGCGPDSVSLHTHAAFFFPCRETFPSSDFGSLKYGATSRLQLSFNFFKMRTPKKKERLTCKRAEL